MWSKKIDLTNLTQICIYTKGDRAGNHMTSILRRAYKIGTGPSVRQLFFTNQVKTEVKLGLIRSIQCHGKTLFIGIH